MDNQTNRLKVTLMLKVTFAIASGGLITQIILPQQPCQ